MRALVVTVLAVCLVLAACDTTTAHGDSSAVGPRLAIYANVSFGTLWVNGQALRDPPPTVAIIHTGANTVTWTARGFREHTCRITYPGQTQPTPGWELDCMERPWDDFLQSPIWNIRPDAELDMAIGGDDLLASEVGWVRAGILHALADVNLRTVVPAGHYFATGQRQDRTPTFTQATAPMTASAIFGPFDAPRITCPEAAGICGGDLFRTTPYLPGSSNDAAWQVFSSATLQWQFASASGATVGAAAYPLNDWMVLVPPSAAGGSWTVAAQETDTADDPPLPVLALGAATVCAGWAYAVNPIEPTLQQRQEGVKWQTDKGMEGCLLVVENKQQQPLAHFVWRFGVLLAADAAAHALMPAIPMAPAAEIHAVGG